MPDIASAGRDVLVVPMHSRRLERARAVQHLQHAVPAATLLFTGVRGLSGGATGAGLLLAVVEIATSGVLLVAILRHLRHQLPGRRHAPSHGTVARVDWISILTGSMLLAEAWERWHVAHHVARPVILLALVTLALGLNNRRVRRRSLDRRALTISDAGIAVGRWPRRFHSSWPDLAEISIGETAVILRRRSGATRRIDLADLENAAEVRAALDAARTRIAPGAEARHS